VTLDTGVLKARLKTRPGFAIEQAWLEGRAMLGEGGARFGLVDGEGREFSCLHGKVSSVAVEESGPVRAVVHVRGDHHNQDGERLFGYEARIYAYAGLPWLEAEYTLVNDADDEFTQLQRVSFEAKPQLGAARLGFTGAYHDLYEARQDFTAFADATVGFGIFAGLHIYDTEGNHVETPNAGELSHKLAHGWLDLSDEQGGVTVVVRRALHLLPKQMCSTEGAVRADLWPERAGTLRLHQGMARTHRLGLLFHAGSGREKAVHQWSTCYEQDLLLWAPGWFAQSGALGPLLPYTPERYPHIEIILREQFARWHQGNLSHGFLDYGDGPQHGSYARRNYMNNNEHDAIHTLALQYARTGEELYHEDMEAAAWHLMDVDIVHHTTRDSMELGGARIHGDGHVQYNCEGYENVSVASSHMWTEGLLEYYFLSGHPRALQMARGIGDCFLRMLERGWGIPPYKVVWHSMRDSGWPLIALTALYEATGEEKWLRGCRRIVDALLAIWKDDEDWGLWLGWHRSLSPLHLGIVTTGLSHYHQLSGDERARDAILRATDIMLSRCAFPDGALMSVDNYGWRWNYFSGVTFESLGYAWHLTGDRRYLQAGWLGHRWNLRQIPPALTGIGLADMWRGQLRYMYWADQAGMLKDMEI
jgi:hypothetical protein